MKMRGIYTPVPTPFKADGSGDVCLDSFRANMRKWAKSSLDGIVVCGSNGELPFTTGEERVRLVRAAKETLSEAGADKHVVAGTYMNSTRETIDCCRAVADAGAEAGLLLPPHYYKGGGMAAAEAFFTAVADASPIPVILYNMPANTGVDLEKDTILRLAGHPNIIGIKDTSGNMTKFGYLANEAPEDFGVFSGSANYILPALCVGAAGGTLAVANIYPEATRALFDAFRKGDMKTARNLQYRLLLASDALTGHFGVPGLKVAMDSVGMYGGPVRGPLLPLSDEKRGQLLAALEKADLDSYEAWRR